MLELWNESFAQANLFEEVLADWGFIDIYTL